MIATYKPLRVEIFDNTEHLTIEQVKAVTGCDLLFNGGLFNMSDFKPCCDIKDDGEWLNNDQWGYWGYGWNTGELPRAMTTADAMNVDNFLSCIWAIQDGKKASLDNYASGIGGIRGRTAFGFKANGEMVILCVSDGFGALTLTGARDKLFEQGCVNGIILDGGGSSQGIFPNRSIYSKRIVSNYICVWIDKGTEKGKELNMLKGIDVSEHQGFFNWETAQKYIDFAIIRVGYGRNNIDKQFLRNINECNRLGIPCGAYWFSYALTVADAKREAQYCINAIKPYKITYPVAFDLEYDSIRYMEKNGVVPTVQLVSDMARAFLNEIEKAGYFAVNYANPDFNSRYFDDGVESRYGSWLAKWYNNPNFNNPPKCLIWQYGTMHIDGIGDIDGNVDLFDFIKWNKSKTGATEQEKPVDKFEKACKALKENGGEKVVIDLANLIGGTK